MDKVFGEFLNSFRVIYHKKQRPSRQDGLKKPERQKRERQKIPTVVPKNKKKKRESFLKGKCTYGRADFWF